MSAQLINFFSEIKNFVPWMAFIAGLGGGLHCVGMCGGLVAASCDRSQDVFKYQIGRLLGYLLLAFFSGIAGYYLNLNSLHPILGTLPALSVGVMFIYWGYKNFRGLKAELPMPRAMGKVYQKLWMKMVYKNQGLSKALFTGFISIMLPCGLLYGVVLGMVALQSTHMALLSMFFFWLGTLPSMVVAPNLVHKVLRPIKQKLPKVFAISLMVIGIVTISFRLGHPFRHQSSDYTSAQSEKHSCH